MVTVQERQPPVAELEFGCGYPNYVGLRCLSVAACELPCGVVAATPAGPAWQPQPQDLFSEITGHTAGVEHLDELRGLPAALAMDQTGYCSWGPAQLPSGFRIGAQPGLFHDAVKHAAEVKRFERNNAVPQLLALLVCVHFGRKNHTFRGAGITPVLPLRVAMGFVSK
jgi:hypothetical protein